MSITVIIVNRNSGELLAECVRRLEAQTIPPARVLLVDDDPEIQGMLSEELVIQGYEVYVAPRALDLRACFDGPQPDVILLDWRLPDGDGMELLSEIKGHWPDTEVLMISGHGTFDTSAEAVKRGAFGYFSKPFNIDHLLLTVRQACEHRRGRATPEGVSAPAGGVPSGFESAAMKSVLHLVQQVAPGEASVLITGERGTGKDVIANLIHALSPRARRPLVKVRCATLSGQQIERELLNPSPGSDLLASAEAPGPFQQVQGGSLLLDEICDLPPEAQAKLLQALNAKAARPREGEANPRLDFRLIAATGRGLFEAIREQRLREDLYYSLGSVTIHLPPLRERREEILPLAYAFLKRCAAQTAKPLTGFTKSAEEALQHYDWPGNVRQLEQEVQQAVLACDRGYVDFKTPA